MKHDNKINTLFDLANNHLLPILEKKVKTFNPQYVQTHNYEIQQEIQKKFDPIPNEELALNTIEQIIGELKAIDFPELAKKTIKEVKNQRTELAQVDYRAELLYQLIEEANKIAPLLSFYVLNRRAFIPTLENIVKSQVYLEECENLEGEPKAAKAADAYQDIAERLYDNYVRVLWELCVRTPPSPYI